MTIPKKNIKAITSRSGKDWHGTHWHMVGWIAAIALVLSASTMTLSASAATTTITPLVLYRSLGDIHQKLNRIEAKIDHLTALVAPPVVEEDQTIPEKALAPAAERTDTSTNTGTAPSAALTQCRQACEDDFNACAKAAGTDQAKYGECKVTYEACWNKCAQ